MPGRASLLTARARWAALLLVLAGAALGAAASRPGWALLEKPVRAALSALPPSPTCGDLRGQWSALLSGDDLAGACPGELLRGWRTRSLLVAVARDSRRPAGVRATALRVLAEAGQLPMEMAEGVMAGPVTAPDARRAALDALADAPGGTEWVERARAIALHDLRERATLRLFAAGEPGTTLDAARALRAHGHPDAVDLVLEGLGLTRAELDEAVRRAAEGRAPAGRAAAWREAFARQGCEDGCVPLLLAILEAEADRRGEEARPPREALGPSEGAIAALFARDGERADHAREEIAAVSAWVRLYSPEGRKARVAAALLHPRAEPAPPDRVPWEAGDPHAALARGGGTPGVTALLLEELADATGTPLALAVGPRGIGARLGGDAYVVEVCAAPRRVPALPEGWTVVPAGGSAALALVEGAGTALRRGDAELAAIQVAAARAAWPTAPGLLVAEAAVLAATGPLPRPEAAGTLVIRGSLLGVLGPDGTLWRGSPPPRRSRRRPPPPDPRPAARAAVTATVVAVRARASPGRPLAVAAYWAATFGHAEIARRLLDGPLAGEAEDVRLAAALLAGEPGAPIGPLSAAAAGEGPGDATASCPPPFDVGPAISPAAPPPSP